MDRVLLTSWWQKKNIEIFPQLGVVDSAQRPYLAFHGFSVFSVILLALCLIAFCWLQSPHLVNWHILEHTACSFDQLRRQLFNAELDRKYWYCDRNQEITDKHYDMSIFQYICNFDNRLSNETRHRYQDNLFIAYLYFLTWVFIISGDFAMLLKARVGHWFFLIFSLLERVTVNYTRIGIKHYIMILTIKVFLKTSKNLPWPILLKAGMSVKQAIFYNILSSVLSYLGMVLGLVLGQIHDLTPWIFSATAGIFLYVALVDMIPELSSGHTHPIRNCYQFFFLLNF